MTTTFDALPDDARLWVFVLSRPLPAEAAATLHDALADFTAAWTSHRRPVEAAFRVLDAHLVLVGARLPDGDVSGCGIDKLVRHLEGTLASLGVPLASGMDTAFRDPAGAVRVADRPTLKNLVQQVHLTPATSVFDATVPTVGAWRSGALERPLAETWVRRYLALASS